MNKLEIQQNHAQGDKWPCQCGDCQEVCASDALGPILDPDQRLEPGTETPAGACPYCGALSYLMKPDEITKDLRKAMRRWGATADTT